MADDWGRRLTRLRARIGTVRARATVAAALIVGVALLAGAVALVVGLRHVLTREVETAARLHAADLAGALEAGTEPRALAVADGDDLLVQVLNRAGRVVAASPAVAGEPPVARLRPGESARVTVPVDDDVYLATATAASNLQGQQLTVIAARSLENVDESARAVTGLLAIGLPLLLIVVAGTIWSMVGHALAPVEAIRRQVDGISAAELHRRVPNPPGADEIARLAATMNRMLGRLEQAQTRQRRFVSDASHELRSPVASIRQHAEVALAHPGGITVAELAETVLAEDLRVQRLVDDLLLLARVDEHTLGLRRRPLDLDDLVFDEARRLRGTTSLRVDTTAVSAGRVNADPASLGRVLRNLTDNAARHARASIAFALAERGADVVLDIDDDGPGIPAGDRNRVFQRFVRLDDARARDAGGAGLGLAIAAELVAAHGGTVAVADSPTGGARLRLRLPRLADPGEQS